MVYPYTYPYPDPDSIASFLLRKVRLTAKKPGGAVLSFQVVGIKPKKKQFVLQCPAGFQSVMCMDEFNSRLIR